MIYRGFIDSESGDGDFTTRVYFTASVSAHDYGDIELETDMDIGDLMMDDIANIHQQLRAKRDELRKSGVA